VFVSGVLRTGPSSQLEEWGQILTPFSSLSQQNHSFFMPSQKNLCGDIVLHMCMYVCNVYVRPALVSVEYLKTTCSDLPEFVLSPKSMIVNLDFVFQMTLMQKTDWQIDLKCCLWVGLHFGKVSFVWFWRLTNILARVDVTWAHMRRIFVLRNRLRISIRDSWKC
jgi:hypothetical protein